jgi:pyridoxal phosphate enzyme (YggS family)
MSDVTTNLAAVLSRIERARALSGRTAGSVRLVAVSKTKPSEAIREAYAAGQRDFGENYAQELAQKSEELRDLPDLRWHFIGHLQSNKAKVVAPIAALVHTVDSPSLARELAKRAPQEQRLGVLVEVNVGGEAQKSGVHPDVLGPLLDAVSAEPRLLLRGLMTIPPLEHDRAARAFADLAELQTRHGGATRLPELSMGMSDDLELAVAAGATLVRVGTAIFGARS